MSPQAAGADLPSVFLQVRRPRNTGALIDLQGPEQALTIVDMDPCRRGRVAGGKLPGAVVPPLRWPIFLQSRPDPVIDRHALEDAVDQGLEVQSGAAGQQRQFVAPVDGEDGSGGIADNLAASYRSSGSMMSIR